MRFRIVAKLVFYILLIALFAACQDSNQSDFHNKNSPQTQEFSPDFVIDWWKVVYEHVAYERIKPPVASRIYAYLGTAIYESALPGMPEYNTLAGQINGLENLPRPDSELEYDWPTIVTLSTYLSVDELLSRFVNPNERSFIQLRDQQLSVRKSQVEKAVYDRSVVYGEILAKALIEWMNQDQFADTRYYTFYQVPSRDENLAFWEPTDFNMEACEPYWSSLRSFVLENGEVCHIPLKVLFDKDPDSPFGKYLDEILEYDRTLTEDQRDIAFHWADDPGETATPPGHWTYIMNYCIQQDRLNLEQAAAIYAMVGIGIADAFIASWYTKYKVNLLRPKTYIQNFMGQPNWEPLVETPPFPEYTSAHSVVSTVAAELLTDIFGDPYSVMDSTHVSIGLDPRPITSFRDAALEASMSRVYGGIHYRFAIEAGIEQGLCVKEKIMERVQLRKDGGLNILDSHE